MPHALPCVPRSPCPSPAPISRRTPEPPRLRPRARRCVLPLGRGRRSARSSWCTSRSTPARSAAAGPSRAASTRSTGSQACRSSSRSSCSRRSSSTARWGSGSLATRRPLAARSPYPRLLGLAMRATGVVVLVFLAVHLTGVRFHVPGTRLGGGELATLLDAQLSTTSHGVPWQGLLYLVGTACVTLHFACGLWGFYATGACRSRERSPAPVGGLDCSGLGLAMWVTFADVVVLRATGAPLLGERPAAAAGHAAGLLPRPRPDGYPTLARAVCRKANWAAPMASSAASFSDSSVVKAIRIARPKPNKWLVTVVDHVRHAHGRDRLVDRHRRAART